MIKKMSMLLDFNKLGHTNKMYKNVDNDVINLNLSVLTLRKTISSLLADSGKLLHLQTVSNDANIMGTEQEVF